MGQKIHPLGLRLGITENHRSHWFGKKLQYAHLLKEDYELRDFIKKYINKNVTLPYTYDYGGIVQIYVEHIMNQVEVQIHAGSPGLLIRDQKIYELRDILQKKLEKQGRSIELHLIEIKQPILNATILAKYIAQELEKRGAFRRIMRKIIQRTRKAGVQGIKIQISGRLNGADIARTEWIREGRVPLQTLRAKIDYAEYHANTTYGILGIKIWVFQGEELFKNPLR
uniref:Small ribosomal subunit protein uS3c n=1 Tax=Entransia fimbriata TaxID=130991 RepID=A0A191T4U9_9VIRI|nr:ribosomal protein S3 [Entransia fimbriata]ANI25415.1 ribosomal protein S3 [Entransia fimbriata]WKT05757.1 ribosomal protein S3 [Entransia fimbriata]WKT05876.1 ribosomal protein S3 [Entransia fimbriata]